ncbi:MAG: SDR family oxidoreductase [Phenylobacterium sp.]|uniref:SDR family NAD(P)-dependent oxidoreductase n=1 Tax=Phenylobacterium sp. TaxID=1871053 RepID=UPI0025E8F169|nr:SDR family oxidoreductase [Phenylobacterium sp.]MBI1198664.1 SDR family oxidoreductase [Phenylobacterium sp.]
MDPNPLFPPGAALVIGGSGGVGRAVCQALVQAGTDVAFTYRKNAAAAAEVTQALEAAGRRVASAALELSDGAAVKAFVDKVASDFDRLHTVVLCAGADISMSYVADADEDEWRRTIDGDLTGSFHVIKSAIPHLRKGGGSIVAMTSAGLLRHPQKDIFSVVPKAGVEALMRGVAREEGRFGIRANSIALGVIDAGLFDRLRDRLSDDFVEAMKKNTALRRFGTPQDAAEAALYLASSRGGFVTGHSLALDGGFSV